MVLTRSVLAASWRSWSASDLRRVGPGWLQPLWTLAFCIAVAALFTVVGFALYASGEGAWRNARGWLHWYGINLVVALTIGFTIHGLHELLPRLAGRDRIRGWSERRRAIYFAGVPIVGVAVGWPVGGWLVSGQAPGWFRVSTPNAIAASVLLSLLFSFACYRYFEGRARRLVAERRAADAQLRLLQAQIEPHFLFNTLANVQALLDHDVAQARAMLESFTDYLRASIGTLRDGGHTLGAEAELVRAYLELLRMRLAGRLVFWIDIDPALAAQPLPALLLQPLVENAVHHGIEPKVDGGSVRLTARAVDGRLQIDIDDDGIGLAAAAARRRRGNGIALDNLRERLATLYGGDASLMLAATAGGTRATLRMPLA